jgi:ribosome maturation factor RimP
MTEWACAHFFCFGRPVRGPDAPPLPANTASVTDEGRLPQIRAAAERVARSYGLDIFDVQFRREPVGWVLRVVLDRPTSVDAEGRVLVEPPEQSIGIEECQRVSQDLSAILDVEDPVDRHYTLEVSSPGLERALRDRQDYERFSGRMAKIVVREAVNGQMHFEGRLRGVEGEDVVLEGSRQRLTPIRLDNIARARLAVEF